MHLVRATDRLRRRLGQPEVKDLAGGDQFGHRAHCLLDRYVGVDAVLVVEVDMTDAKPLQRGIAGGPDVLGAAADAGERSVGAAHVAKLRRHDDAVAASAECAPDELLVLERAVHVGRIEEVDAEVEGAVDGRDRLRVVTGTVELGHPHAAEAHGGDFERGELAGLHRRAFYCRALSRPALSWLRSASSTTRSSPSAWPGWESPRSPGS